MSYRLEGDGGIFHFNHTSWGQVLELAAMYGWKPKGTEPPETNLWGYSGGYHSSGGQRVKAADAGNLVDAHERALMCIPEEYSIRSKIITVRTLENAELEGDFSREDWENTLRRFIKFCRAGEFCID